MNSIEICAGAGGQALGLESAGFEHVSLVEIEAPAVQTLRINRPGWHVIEGDVHHFSATPYRGVELLAGGVPCPPFSKAGKQLGHDDERDLFPEAIRLADECRPQADQIAPTLVGGSKKHGGPDLGPTRARAAWAQRGVDGRGLADDVPASDFEGMPRLTARLQGFPDSWQFAGKKTAAYRQIGNAFPPPVAQAVGSQIWSALNEAAKPKLKRA